MAVLEVTREVVELLGEHDGDGGAGGDGAGDG